MAEKQRGPNRLAKVSLDEASIARGNPDQEHERAIALFDILEDNVFAIPGREGPYALTLGLVENKLSFAITTVATEPWRIGAGIAIGIGKASVCAHTRTHVGASCRHNQLSLSAITCTQAVF